MHLPGWADMALPGQPTPAAPTLFLRVPADTQHPGRAGFPPQSDIGPRRQLPIPAHGQPILTLPATVSCQDDFSLSREGQVAATGIATGRLLPPSRHLQQAGIVPSDFQSPSGIPRPGLLPGRISEAEVAEIATIDHPRADFTPQPCPAGVSIAWPASRR